MNVSVILFPGSNCEHDVVHTYGQVLGQKVSVVWHQDRDLKNPDLVVLPGGFTYGDYLRTGALAKLSPVMQEVARFARSGGNVLGICNGFQILCESGLLPGALLRNVQMKFLSQFVHLKVENVQTPWTMGVEKGQVITCPIAHAEGNYFIDPEGLKTLEGEGQVVFRYCKSDSSVDPLDLNSNPNGSTNAIAGICNSKRNVVGLMPHPERAVESVVGYVGNSQGISLFKHSVAA